MAHPLFANVRGESGNGSPIQTKGPLFIQQCKIILANYDTSLANIKIALFGDSDIASFSTKGCTLALEDFHMYEF